MMRRGSRVTLRRLATAAAVLISVAMPCAASEVWPISIEPPKDFEGPIQQQAQGGTAVAWTRKETDGTATLLQVTTYNVGMTIAKMSPEDGYAGARQYLGEMLAGVARRRTDFKQTEPVRMQLAGRPAARVSWTGKMNGMPTNGVMFCVIVGTYMVNLHTQGSGSTPTPSMQAAMKSIEAIINIVAG